MDLVKLDRQIPIKGIPEIELNRILFSEFSVWISGLLSLSDETSAERLELALPAIKEHFWSMGFYEIKKAFEMYADGKLKLEPIPNYLDRILVGKIFSAYKEQLPRKQVKPIPQISSNEKKELTSSGMKKCIDYFLSEENILDGYINFLYDIFYDDGFLPTDKEIKVKFFNDARDFLLLNLDKPKDYKEYKTLKEVTNEIETKNSSKIILKAKEMVVLDFLRKERAKDNLDFLRSKYNA